MREGWTVPPIWKGERCFIIAGGPSVDRDYLRSHLLPGRVLAVKDAVLLRPRADCFFYGDPARLHRKRPDIFNAYKGPMIVKRSVHDDIPARVHQVRRARADKTRINGLSLDPAFLGGHDSGGSALNLAFHFGAVEIFLVGFDYFGRHWNPLHPFPNAKMRAHVLHRTSVDAMASNLRAAGVKVYNCSEFSTLEEYPYAPLASIS